MTGTRTVPLLLVPIPDIICYLNILVFFSVIPVRSSKMTIGGMCKKALLLLVFAIKPSHQNPGNI